MYMSRSFGWCSSKSIEHTCKRVEKFHNSWKSGLKSFTKMFMKFLDSLADKSGMERNQGARLPLLQSPSLGLSIINDHSCQKLIICRKISHFHLDPTSERCFFTLFWNVEWSEIDLVRHTLVTCRNQTKWTQKSD